MVTGMLWGLRPLVGAMITRQHGGDPVVAARVATPRRGDDHPLVLVCAAALFGALRPLVGAMITRSQPAATSCPPRVATPRRGDDHRSSPRHLARPCGCCDPS